MMGELTAMGPQLGVANDRQYRVVGACLVCPPRSDPLSGGVAVFWASEKVVYTQYQWD